jgi:hypothetical protein
MHLAMNYVSAGAAVPEKQGTREKGNKNRLHKSGFERARL